MILIEWESIFLKQLDALCSRLKVRAVLDGDTGLVIIEREEGDEEE